MLFIQEFELVEDGEGFLAVPFDMEGVARGVTAREALDGASEMLRGWAHQALERDGEVPEVKMGHEARCGGSVVAVAADVCPSQFPAVTAAEAARRLGVSSARVAQLCSAHRLESWREGASRMVTVESIEERLANHPGSGRPRGRDINRLRSRLPVA